MIEKIENNAINPNNGNEQPNNKTNTFNLVIGIATLLIALLGATFAYFSATARSEENDVTVRSAYVSIEYDGGTEIKATNLIPSSIQVALKKYQREDVVAHDPTVDGDYNTDYDDEKNEVDRRCVDANGREVCYVYQFSIYSDGTVGEETEVLATLKVNTNEFENLSYLLYEVTFQYQDGYDPVADNWEQEANYVLKDKYGIRLVDSYNLVSDFTLRDTNPDNVDFTETGFEKFEKPEDLLGENKEYLGTVNPVACLFGKSVDFDTKDKDDTSRCKTYNVTNRQRHTYQLVIWLEETGQEQKEQNMTFQGTVAIEVSGGSDYNEYENGQITGKE